MSEKSAVKERNERGLWRNKSEFLLACIGYAVGLGNIWRFPYLCFKSGGGAFLFPYFTMLLLCGIPLLYMEMAIGQFTRFGPIQAIGMLSPLMKGVGFATVVISFILCTYYNVIITWALYYLFHSFRPTLPWYTCNSTWSSANCTEVVLTVNSSNSNWTVSSTQDFFDRKVLGKTSGIHDMGNMQWEVFGCFVLAWILCYLCVFKGIKSAGKVVYFTATFPYIILIILLVKSASLPGAIEGVYYFVRPVWKELLNVQVWVNAAAQNFNSIGIGFGSLIAFASYNRRQNSILRDTLVIACVNSATSILAGFVIFCAMGHMAHILGKAVEDVVRQGPELVFIVYPQIFASMPVPSLWAILFFFMLVCLGIDSQFAMIEVVNTCLSDAWSGMLISRYFKRKELLSLAVCLTAFLIGIPNLMQGGIYVFTLLDSYTAVVALMFLAFFEIITVCWLYGGRRLSHDVKKMTGEAPWLYFVICWLICAPILVGVILLFSIIQYKPITYGDYDYPVWADGIGWIIALCSMICIPACALHTLASLPGSLMERLQASLQPQIVRMNDDSSMELDASSGNKYDSQEPPAYVIDESPFITSL